jgi:hypothetical protein
MRIALIYNCTHRTERRRSTLTRMSLGDITALQDISDTKGVDTSATVPTHDKKVKLRVNVHDSRKH